VRGAAVNYDPELYNDVSCNGACSPTTGNQVAVTLGATTSNIDFALKRNDVILSGTITDAVTGAVLGSVAVLVHDQNGAPVASVFSEANGTYRASLGAPGTYFARTLNITHRGYVDQLYNAIDCSRCDVTTGTPIPIAAGVPTTNINFALTKQGGTITGRVTDSSSSPVEFALVQIYSPSGEFVTDAVTAADGTYTPRSQLAAGSYFASASKVGFASQLYNGVACDGECDPTTGTAITVLAGQTTPNVNFALNTSLARVTGRVTATPNDTALAGVQVVVFDGTGTPAGEDTSESDGSYEVVLAESGTYYARTFAPNPQYSNQLYQNISCSPSCDPTLGTPIAATLGSLTSAIDFTLTAAGCGAIAVQPDTLPNGTIGTPYAATITASGGTGPYTFTLSMGTLPVGVELDGNTGALAGDPVEAGSFLFEVVVTDSAGCVGSRSYTVIIQSNATGTTLSASATNPAYGTPVTLTAVVTPSLATGTVTFQNGLTPVGTATLSGGVATLTLPLLNAGTYDFTATYGGDGTYDPSTSNVVQVVVRKVTPEITWADPAPIVYGTALSGTQLNATASVPGNFTYSIPAGTILDAGPHGLSVIFIPTDTTNYTDASKSVSLVVNKANQQIAWTTPASITYGTPLGAAQLNATVTVPGPSPAGALTYTPPAGTVLPAGTHTLSVAAAETTNYNPASAQVTISVLKATPVFSNLTSPIVIVGSTSTVVGGKIAAGTVIPGGNVTITINGVSQPAAIQANGTFTATFATASLAIVQSGYPIAFSYAGDANFNSATGTAVLYITYGIDTFAIPSFPVPGNGVVLFRVKILNAAGTNLSSRTIDVTAYGIRKVGETQWTPVQGLGNGDTSFKFQSVLSKSYLYLEKLNHLTTGNYVLGFKVEGDPIIHEIAFSVR
jgi:hypothetical protein